MSMVATPVGVAVPTCARCAGPLESGDLRCAVCGLACPQHAHAPSELVQVLRCTDCGAAVSYSAEAQAPKCKFCGAVMKVEQPTDPVEQADWVVPFVVTPDQAHQALKQWMSTLGFFRPSDLANAATLEGINPIWWAGWIVNADAYVSWTADSNAGAHRSAWAPHAGQTRLPFRNLVVSASRGLALKETRELTPRFDLGRALPVAQQQLHQLGPQGATLEQFDAQRSAARKTITDAISGAAAQTLQQGTIPGTTFRNVHVAVLLRGLETRRVALPSYVLAYRYDKRVYRAVVHGQDITCVFGSAPISIAKIVLVIGIVAAIVLAALTILTLTQ